MPRDQARATAASGRGRVNPGRLHRQRGRQLKLRYCGQTKNNAWLKHRTAALNLRNLIGKGLTWRAGGWALAT
jgi:hypothetical protein